MKTIHAIPFTRAIIASIALLAGLSPSANAQTPQDNWYQDAVWVKTMPVADGGLTNPYGVAIGRDRRIYVGDQGAQRIQVYLPDGTFSFGITSPFGGGESFNQPRGMIFDRENRLYVADQGNNCVYVFMADGTFVRKIGGVTGSGDSQLNGVMDVGVALDGQVYVLERTNSRVSVFDSNGVFLRKWGEVGLLDGQLYCPLSIAVSTDDRVYLCLRQLAGYDEHHVDDVARAVKEFDKNGKFKRKILGYRGGYMSLMAAASVRITPGGNPSVLLSYLIDYEGDPNAPWGNSNPVVKILSRDLESIVEYTLEAAAPPPWNDYRYSCHAFGPDGTFVVCQTSGRKIYVWKQACRELLPSNPNALPIPAVWKTVQRPNSPLIDIDYEVTDADNATVHTGLLVFREGVVSLANCIRDLTLVEGTETKVGEGVASNTLHRVTWNAGADWATALGDFQVAALARDSRQNLLDIHYLDLPADRGVGPLRISRCPLIESDYMQVWWWLLATHDTGIRLEPAGKIFGVGGSYDNVLLCDGSATPATKPEGRSYIFAKMGVREATTAEVTWAKEGAGTSPPLQNTPARPMGGRPLKLNEYGFDTGDWTAASLNARWVIVQP